MAGRRLSKDALLDHAIDQMEGEGVGGFTLRKVAKRAACDPMAVLYHFQSKDGLYLAMADRMERMLVVSDGPATWRAGLEEIALAYRGLARRFPRSFWLVQRSVQTGTADLTLMEAVHRALRSAGVPDALLPSMCLGWSACVIGLALGEVSGMIRPFDDRDRAAVEALPPDGHALSRALLPFYAALDADVVFATTMAALHDGIAARGVARPGGSAPAGAPSGGAA